MKLIELKNYTLTISPEAFALRVFRKLWDRDKTKTKDRAYAEMSYVFFMEDFRSDFSGILDEQDRREEVMKQIVLPKGWKEDKLVKDALDYYREQNDKIYAIGFVRDAQFAMDKIRQYFREVDLQAVDKNGKPIHDISKLDRVLGNSASLLKNLTELESQVKQALQAEKSNVRGGKEKSIFEDGIK
jgi:hypothetical protein